jgi:16S rRNA (cytidine1402-2'-O)-methyltransferase
MTTGRASSGRLIVCPTPIGNLQDITLRVLDELARADVVACEDTRHTGRLLRRHGLVVATVSLHERNEGARARELVARMRAGQAVALVSDAGTPLISDPGFALVRACIAAQLPLQVLPGASAVPTALVASGLPVDRWCFVGFLPRRRGELERVLSSDRTLVAFESPRRLAGTLALLAAADAARPVVVCRELTKLHEEIRRGSAAELAAHYRARPARGELVLVLGATPTGSGQDAAALAALRELVAAGAKPRRAAAVVARLTETRANELYGRLTREPVERAGGQ